jgi:hypothetical protein
MTPQDLNVFIEQACRSFEKSVGDKAHLGIPIIRLDTPPDMDCLGLVQFNGQEEGMVYLAFPGPMIEALLGRMGEPDHSPDMRRDFLRELVAGFSGHVRDHFGSSIRLGSPQVFLEEETRDATLPPRRIEFPLVWKDHTARLGLGLEKAAPDLL